MRFSVEHQRNFAYDLIRLRNMGLSLANVMKEDEPVIIYGLDFIGKEIYADLKDKVNIICFIDKAYDMKEYDGIQVYAVDNEALKKRVEEYSDVKVIVGVMSAWKEIKESINLKFLNLKPIPIYMLTATMKLENIQWCKGRSEKVLTIIEDILSDKEIDIEKMVLVGTSYTSLLYLLMSAEWDNTLFIAERFFLKEVAERMEENGITVLYEREAGDFYDITYIMSEYAQRHNIKIYGHDHLFLSRAFLENGISVIEDGNANYAFKHSIYNQKILDNGEIYYPFGFQEYTQQIFLTNIMEIPNKIKGKVEVINPDKLWKNKSFKEKEVLSKVFSYPYQQLLELTNKGKDILILTEPFATDMALGNAMSNDRIIEELKRILSAYDFNKVIIKPHPADSIDYKYYLPECTVISKNFPVQMLMWTGVPIKKVVLCKGSTCSYIFKEGYEIDFYEDIRLIDRIVYEE